MSWSVSTMSPLAFSCAKRTAGKPWAQPCPAMFSAAPDTTNIWKLKKTIHNTYTINLNLLFLEYICFKGGRTYWSTPEAPPPHHLFCIIITVCRSQLIHKVKQYQTRSVDGWRLVATFNAPFRASESLSRRFSLLSCDHFIALSLVGWGLIDGLKKIRYRLTTGPVRVRIFSITYMHWSNVVAGSKSPPLVERDPAVVHKKGCGNKNVMRR